MCSSLGGGDYARIVLNLRGVDVAGVKRELEQFVEKTKPKSSSGGNVLSAHLTPMCGRPEALALRERVLPILNRLYPEWQTENEEDKYFEFRSERDACSRLLARIGSHEEIDDLFQGQDDAPQLSAGQMHELVWQAASAQWATGHRHEAVFAASKAVNSYLQEKLNRRDLSDVKLVQEAFSEKAAEIGKARLRFSSIDDDQTRDSMRKGAMSFGVGCFQAIRNPVGHLPNEDHELDEQPALERMAALSLFLRWVDDADLETSE